MKNIFKNLNSTEKALFSSSFFHGLGVETAYFVGITGYAAYNLHATPSLIATIMVCVNIAQILGSTVSGMCIDKWGPQKIVGAAALVTVGVSLCSLLIGTNVKAFIAFAAVLGFLLSTSKTSYNAYAPYVEEGTSGLKRINALVMFGSYSSAIFGPTLGGFIVKYYPTMTVFLFTAVAVFISFVVVLFAKEQYTPPKEEEPKHPLREATEGVRLVFAQPSLRYYLVVGIMLWFSFGAFDALESLYYKDIVHASIQWMGWINGAIGVGMVVGVVALSKFPSRYINSVLLAIFVGFEGIGSIVYVATHSVYVVMLGGFLLGLAFGVAEPMMRTLIQADSPLASVGRVLGAIQTFRVGFTIIPLMLAPSLAKIFGIQQVLIGASVLTVILSFTLVPLARSVDKSLADKRLIYAIDPLGEGEDVSPHDRVSPSHD